MTRSRSGSVRRAAVIAVLAGTLVPVIGPASADAGVLPVRPDGYFVAHARGIGHGHGMSQYGARGAALAGRNYQQILAFYYARTTLRRLHTTPVRVLLGDFGRTTTVQAYRGLAVTGVHGPLPYRGVRRYRLVADHGSGLSLQRLRAVRGARWRVYRTGLGDGAAFHPDHFRSTRIIAPNRTSNYYYGWLIARRARSHGTAGGVYTVNRLSLDRYTAGVVPREMPSDWPRAAVNAQAVAARTYARYEVLHPRGTHYDICDTTDCQFYGGHYYYDSSGHRVWSDYTSAAHATSNQVLTYGGAPIFAQFGASDGGWASSGGEPYLAAHHDPFDSTRSGDPYLSQQRRVSVAAVARYYGLLAVYHLELGVRDGHGLWGGRVQRAYVYGIGPRGHPKRVATTGGELGSVFGFNTDWLLLTRR